MASSVMTTQQQSDDEEIVIVVPGSKSQSSLLARRLIIAAEPYIRDGVRSRLLIQSFNKAFHMAIEKIKEIAVPIDEDERRTLLAKYVASTLSFGEHNYKLATMVVDAVLETEDIADETDYDYYDVDDELGSIAIHKVPTGTIGDSFFVKGAVFKNMFSCAGQIVLQNPKILLLDINLDDPKSQKEIDSIIRLADKLSMKHCPTIVLSLQAIGDWVTKLFASKNIVYAGLVADDDMDRVEDATRGTLLTSLNNFKNQYFGTCESFEQKQFEGDMFNIFSGCPSPTATIVLQGADQFAEVEQILHDKIILVKSAVKKNTATTCGDAIYMEISRYLSQEAHNVGGEYEQYIKLFAKALEDLSRDLNVDMAGFDDATAGETSDNVVWEPSIVKIHSMTMASYLACSLII